MCRRQVPFFVILICVHSAHNAPHQAIRHICTNYKNVIIQLETTTKYENTWNFYVSGLFFARVSAKTANIHSNLTITKEMRYENGEKKTETNDIRLCWWLLSIGKYNFYILVFKIMPEIKMYKTWKWPE